MIAMNIFDQGMVEMIPSREYQRNQSDQEEI